MPASKPAMKNDQDTPENEDDDGGRIRRRLELAGQFIRVATVVSTIVIACSLVSLGALAGMAWSARIVAQALAQSQATDFTPHSPAPERGVSNQK